MTTTSDGTSTPAVRIGIDTEANAAYIALSDNPVAATRQITSDVLVDLDEHGVAVGVEVLRVDATLPLDLIRNEFHVRSEVVELLCAIRPSVSGFLAVSHGHNGQSNPDPTRTAVGI